MTLAIWLGFVNVCAGIMLVTALLTFIGGSIRYFVLLGTERRKDALATMFWGINILFVLVVLLGIVDMLQGPFIFVIGIGVLLFLVFAVVSSFAKK